MTTHTFFEVEDGVIVQEITTNIPLTTYATINPDCVYTDYNARIGDAYVNEQVYYKPEGVWEFNSETLSWEPGTTPYIVDGVLLGVLHADENGIPQLSEGQKWDAIRQRRDRQLAATDWIKWRAWEKGEPIPQVWLDYWQELRDIPDNFERPEDVIWPIAPQ